MSATFTINNFSPANIIERGELNAAVAASASPVTLNTVNNNSFAALDYIILGTPGAENCELKQVTSVAGATSVTVPTVSFPHVRFEKITKLYGNKITVYRAPNVNGLQPADTEFVVFAGSQIDIDVDQVSTPFTDPNGSSSYWYKFVYTNTTTGTSTSLADSSSARGQGFGNYCSLDSIRNQAGFARAPYITNALIDQKRQAAQSTINGALNGLYTLPFATPVDPLIEDMTIRLAAGWLLLSQYDTNSVSGQKGQAMVDSVMNAEETGDLDKLRKGMTSLVGADGTPTTLPSSTLGFSGWPNATTATAEPENSGGEFMFRASDIHGGAY